jgi:hypothetical protein
MTGGHDGTPQALGAATTSRGGFGDRGAVAVEFAILFPVLMLLLVGFFEFGVAMTEKNATGSRRPGRGGVRSGGFSWHRIGVGEISVAAADIVRRQSRAAVPSGHSGRPDRGSMASQSDSVLVADVVDIRKRLLADTTHAPAAPNTKPVSEVRAAGASSARPDHLSP